MRILDFADGFESSTEPTSVAYSAAQIAVVPTGTLVSDNAQDALVEINEKVDTKLDASKKGAVNGVAELDAGGKIPASQIPGLALVTVSTVANITARNALTVESGDVAFVTSEGKSYVYDGTSWVLLNTDTAVAAHSGQTTGVHGVTGNIVGTTDTQTLTNKTLTAPVINSPTGLSKNDVGLSAVDNTSDATKNAATATLTNKTLTSPAINGANFDFGTASNTNRLKLPSAGSGTFLGLTNVQGLLAFDTVLNKPVYNTGTAWTPVGSGSGSGGINYITDSDAESGLGLWSVMKQSGGTFNGSGVAFPVDITFAQNSTTPLRGNSDFLLTKGSGNFQGNYVRYPFTIARADVATPFTIKFKYKVASGTFADGDVRVYIYDTVTASVIEPSQRDLKNVGIVTQYSATFQTPSSANGLELVLFLPNTTTTAWSLQFEDFSVGPQNTVQGLFGTDLKDNGTITIGATTTAPTKGTVVTDKIRSRIVGDHGHIKLEYKQSAAGTNGSGDYLYTLPNNWSFDSSKVSFYTSDLGTANPVNTPVGLGTASMSWGANSSAVGQVVPYDATRFRIVALWSNNTGSTNGAGYANGSAYYNLGSTGSIAISADFLAPILGLSSGVTYSSDAGDGRDLSALATASTTTTIGTTASIVNFATVVSDKASSYSSNRYTFKASVRAQIRAEILANITYTSSSTISVFIRKNGITDLAGSVTPIQVGGFLNVFPVSFEGDFVTGDYVEIFISRAAGITASVHSDPTYSRFTISTKPTPAAIAAGETVAVRASTTAGQSVTTSMTTVVYGTVTKSSHGIGTYDPTTGIFTALISGMFTFNAKVASAAYSLATTAGFAFQAVHNNTTVICKHAVPGVGATNVYYAQVNDSYPMLAGETLRFQVAADTATTLSTTPGACTLSIQRTGNY